MKSIKHKKTSKRTNKKHSKKHSKRYSKKQSKRHSKKNLKKQTTLKNRGHITYSPKKKKFILSHNISSHQRDIFIGNTLNHSLTKFTSVGTCGSLCTDKI
jgi:hypothetical protein